MDGIQNKWNKPLTIIVQHDTLYNSVIVSTDKDLEVFIIQCRR